MAKNVISPPEQGTLLLKYEKAVRALAEAESVDEVKQIHDQAVPMKAYARQAKDERMMKSCLRLQERAEFRLNWMMEERQG